MSTRTPASAPPSLQRRRAVTGLRSKLLLGFGGLLAVLLTVSILANLVLARYSRASQRMLREDLSSVSAVQDMRDAVLGIQADLLALINGTTRQDVMASLDQHVREFDAGLKMQQSSATLPHEPEKTEDLARWWTQYRSVLARAAAPGLSQTERNRIFEGELMPLASALRSSSQDIADVNIASIREVEEYSNQAARRARLVMHGMTVCGGGVALLFAVLIGRLILRPVRALTASVQEIERGNLDLTVPVTTRDELGRLAEAFNAMAAQLRVFRRSDHEKLLRTQRTTQLAIDSLPDGVVVVNPQGGIELTNETAKRLFGIGPGQRAAELTTPAGRRVADLHARVAAEGRLPDVGGYAGALKVPATGGNGAHAGDGAGNGAADGDGPRPDHDRYFLPRAVPILDEEKRPIGSTVMLADVTEFRRLDQMKNGLLSLVSHELKTPLTSMRMILPLVLEGKTGPLTPRQRELLSAAREDADRLHQIVENLLDMGRLESGRALMDVRPTPAGDLLTRSVEPLRPAFRDHDIELDVATNDADPAARQPVLADATRIGHVFANLLGNALRYTPSGGKVRVSLRPLDDRIEFVVADTGTGIPRAYLHRVFEKFFRVPGQPGDSGSGLGLAIVKDVIEAHGGHVGVESTEGVGATFRFSLRTAAECQDAGDTAASVSGGDAASSRP